MTLILKWLTKAQFWEPPALIHNAARDTSILQKSILQPTFANSDLSRLDGDEIEILSIEAIPQTDHVLCGLSDGQVVLYSTEDGKRKNSLCHHSSKLWIDRMACDSQAGILAVISGPVNGAVYKITSDLSSAIKLATMMLSHSVKQLLANSRENDPYVFISTSHSITIWGYKDGESGIVRAFDKLVEKDFCSTAGVWIGDDDTKLIYADPEGLTYYSWDDLSQIGRLKSSISEAGRPKYDKSTAVDDEDDEDFELDGVQEVDRGSKLADGNAELVVMRSVSNDASHAMTTTASPHTAEKCLHKYWLTKLPSTMLLPNEGPDVLLDTHQRRYDGLRAHDDTLKGAQSTSSYEQAAIPFLLPVSPVIQHIIGYRKTTTSPRHSHTQLIFLDRSLWVSSYNLLVPKDHKRRTGLAPRQMSERGPHSQYSQPVLPLATSSTVPGSLEINAPIQTSSVPSPLPTTKASQSSRPPERPYYTRHLFIPDDWVSSNYSNTQRENSMLFILAGPKQGDLVFVKRGEIAVIKNAFLPGTGKRVEL